MKVTSRSSVEDAADDDDDDSPDEEEETEDSKSMISFSFCMLKLHFSF